MWGIYLQVFVNYPVFEREFNDKLATFKAKLLLKNIDSLSVSEKTKRDVLDMILEILDNKPDGDVI